MFSYIIPIITMLVTFGVYTTIMKGELTCELVHNFL